MKVISSIGLLYDDQFRLNSLLKLEVDKIISSVKMQQWHYVGRLKSQESFAQKLESGRVKDLNNLEDFFACTIVVENVGTIKLARKQLKTFFKVHEERPQNLDITHKDSSSFVFDDLRMYVSLKPTSAKLAGPINAVIFEIQIKTFLQHAWSIATHDLVYKSDKISWIKQRVAYQVKAMLENAEVSIEKAAKVKRLPGIPNSNRTVKFQNDIKKLITDYWSGHSLPTDLVRLINSVENVLKHLQISLDDLKTILDEEAKKGMGAKTLNLSPYLTIVQSIINQNPTAIKKYLLKSGSSGNVFKLFLPRELDLKAIESELKKSKRFIST